ncbi:hypothetical protein P7C73_g4113, partial [Tremellales sp. Uapishka_1]
MHDDETTYTHPTALGALWRCYLPTPTHRLPRREASRFLHQLQAVGHQALTFPPSDVRQIPDTQEVFLSPITETSLIVEVLQMVEEGPAKDDLWEAAKYHFNSLAHDNAALSSTITSASPAYPIPSVQQSTAAPSTPRPIVISGQQTIHKYSYDPTGAPRPGHATDIPDHVWIGLALWRVWVGGKKADLICSVNIKLEGGDDERISVEDWWTRAVAGLQIMDYGLFADEQ